MNISSSAVIFETLMRLSEVLTSENPSPLGLAGAEGVTAGGVL